MATVKENIVNSLKYFYKKLWESDLDTMQADIEELSDMIMKNNFEGAIATEEATNGILSDDDGSAITLEWQYDHEEV